LGRVVTTNDSGEYTAQNLPPDTYSIRVEKAGFEVTSIASIPLEVGKSATAPVVLQVGGSTQTVEVTTEAAQLQTQDATVGQVMGEKQVNDLPLNGRNMLQLASLTAGVSAEEISDTGNPGQYGTRNLYITVDGGRASSTNYVLDGVAVRSMRFNNMSVITSVDATKEFNVVRSVASTEYGQGTATVTMVTKSGGNQFHGSAYEFTRSEIFDARNYFSTYAAFPRKPVYHRNQYGGTVGGPIVKDRVFGFVGYEHQGSDQSQPAYANFPTATQMESIGINVNAPNTQFPLYNVLLPTFAAQGIFNPSPSCGVAPYPACGGNDFEYSDNFVDDYTTWTGRADETISSKQNMFERYIDYNAQQLTPGPFEVTQNPLIGRNMTIEHTYVFNSWLVNELRLGWNHYYNYGVTVSPYTNASWDTTAGVTNVTGDTLVSEFGRPTFTINGYSSFGGDSGNGQGDAQDVYSIGDTISIVRGKHSVRAGVQFSERQAAQQAELATDGAFTFSNLTEFQNGICSTCQGSDGTSKGHYTDQTWGVFANDIWQINPRITLNYGMRWEYDSPFVEKNGLEAGFDIKDAQIAFHKVPPTCSATVTLFCIPPGILGLGIMNLTPNYFPAGIINPTKDRFSPRVGVAYQATPSLVVRGGYGIYVENVNTNELQFTRNISPLYITQLFNNVSIAGAFPSIANYVPNTSTGFPAPFGTDPNNRLPYSTEWDFSIQKSLGHQTVLEAAYTGSVTYLLWRRYDRNEDIFPGPDQAPTQVRPFSSYSHGMLTSANVGHANFQGGSIKIEQRPIRGFYYLGVYQYSKNEDDESGEADANDTSFSNNLAFDRAPSNFDVRHRGTISGGYNLPFGQGQNHLTSGIGNVLAGGWTIQPIVSIHSGFPFSISNDGATFGQYTAFRGFLAPGRTIASAKLSHRTAAEWYDATAFCSTVTLYGVAPQCPMVTASGNGLPGNGAWQGNVRRNILTGPGTFQNDVSVIKNFKIHESLTGQFRAEAFNVMNKTILANPNSTETTGTAGTITSTAADNRDLQFALKLLF
jgi:hypothetical protein